MTLQGWYQRLITALLLCAATCARLDAQDTPAGSAVEPADTAVGTAPPATDSPAASESVPAPSGKTVLRYRFQPQQVARYEVSDEQKMTALVDGVTETQVTKCQTRRSYKVSATGEDGSGELQLAIDWAKMSVAFGNGVRLGTPVEFQSDDPAKQPDSFRHVLGTIGRPRASVWVTPRGIATALDATEPLPAAKPVTPGIDASPESYLLALPETGVAPGDEWKERFETRAVEERLPVRVTIQRTYKLVSLKDDLATISYRTTVLTPIRDPQVAAQLIGREVSGTIVFDNAQGLLVSREVKVDQTVLNYHGPKSSLRFVNSYRERLLTDKGAEGSEIQTSSVQPSAR